MQKSKDGDDYFAEQNHHRLVHGITFIIRCVGEPIACSQPTNISRVIDEKYKFLKYFLIFYYLRNNRWKNTSVSGKSCASRYARRNDRVKAYYNILYGTHVVLDGRTHRVDDGVHY